MELKSKRLKIRFIQLKDTADLFEYRSDAITNKFQNWIPKNKQDAANYINKNPTTFNQSGTWFQVGIILLETDKLIGDIGIHFKDKEQIEIGYTLSKKYQKKGYATEALKVLIDYLFTDLNKHRIVASIDPDNIHSIRLMERLGFRKEGHFIESLFFKGKWVDDVVYALLKREWHFRN